MQGKVAIVTGAAGGIGAAIVRKLGAKGVKVVGTGRSEAKLAALKEALGAPWNSASSPPMRPLPMRPKRSSITPWQPTAGSTFW